MAWTIYCHQHIESGRRYVGLTKHTMLKRWNRHVYNAFNRNDNTHFANAIRKYGKDAFSHTALEVCSSLEEANEAEEAWIDSFSTRYPEFGFNIMKGGEHRPSDKSPQMTAQARANNKAALNTPESRARRTIASKAVMSDPGRLAIVAAAARAHAVTPEGKLARSQSAKSISPEVRAVAAKKTGDRLRGKALRPEHCEKLRAALTGRKQNSLHAAKSRAAANRLSEINRAKKHCRNGHSLEDCWKRADGRRICRTCSQLNRSKSRGHE